MDAIQLLLLSVLLFGIFAFASLLLKNSNKTARYVSGIGGMIASFVGLIAAILAATSRSSILEFSGPLPFGNFILEIDGLSALMISMISILGFAASLYSISYLEKYSELNLGSIGFFINLFIAMMMLVVVTANAFYFLIFWEMMTLVSYFLVTFEGNKKESIQAGYLYILVAHAGGALIMLSFIVLYLFSGSFEFDSFRQAQLSPVVKSLVFLLAFVGFGAKAGMVPLHFWMPSAYSAAPSHAAALMSSVMKKTAIYGILRVCVDFLGPSMLWWGLLVLFFGVLSAVIGVLFALIERDIKRLLAFSSVENVGIIFLGIGAGMIGLAIQQPVVTLLGFLAALYHMLNHSFFKGLLFLGAGSVSYHTQTRNLNEMGGLARRMPWTALAFLTGALAVTAIPPFNGFVSEWFTYQSLLATSGSQDFVIRLVAPLSAVLLALAGAMAVMVFIKAYGGAFTGPTRSEQANLAVESPGTMLAGMAILAIGCLALGVGAPIVAPFLAQVASSIPDVTSMTVSSGVWVYPVDISQGLLSTPLTAILLLGLLAVPLVMVTLYGGRKAGRRTVDDPWACGYGYSIQMSVSASSFDQPMKTTFRRIYSLRPMMQKPWFAVKVWSRRTRETISHAEPVLERIISRPTTRAIEYLGHHIQALQMGDIRVYCLYIILTLAVLLIVIFK